jgi:hypothetical protein
VCTVKKIAPSEFKFFICMIIVMKSVFHLCHVVTFVYIMEAVVSIVKSFNPLELITL